MSTSPVHPFSVQYPPQVGEEVEFEVRKDRPSLPLWDFSDDGDGSGTWVKGRITSINKYDNDFRVDWDRSDGGTESWHWPMPGHRDFTDHERPGYIRRVGAAPTAAASTRTLAHTEIIGTSWHHSVPDPILAAALDRGELAIRRRTMAWPIGKRLVAEQERVEGEAGATFAIHWYWVDE